MSSFLLTTELYTKDIPQLADTSSFIRLKLFIVIFFLKNSKEKRACEKDSVN